jgi:hypothetical protein
MSKDRHFQKLPVLLKLVLKFDSADTHCVLTVTQLFIADGTQPTFFHPDKNPHGQIFRCV